MGSSPPVVPGRKGTGMIYKKTPSTKRGTYTYRFTGEDGKLQVVKLVAGLNGVTADDIKMLHAMDDAEVYNNIKNSKPQTEDWQKATIEKWKAQHPGMEIEKNWNISLNELVGEDGAEREELVGTCMVEEDAVMERLHEIVDSLTDLQKETYRKVILEEMTNADVAREEGKSEASVRKIINRIKYLIGNDKELQRLLE